MIISYKIDAVEEFSDILDSIESDEYYEIAVKALNKVPNYFWFVAASSSGKYHPKSSLGLAGLYRHVQSVCKICECLLEHPLYQKEFSSETRDEIRVACLLHDCLKQGTGEGTSFTVDIHPILVKEALQPFENIKGLETPNPLEKQWNSICDLISSHMGCWNSNKKGEEILPLPVTEAQKFVHICDYLASRKFIEVDTTDRISTVKKNDSWKDTSANIKQISYIKSLAKKCIQKNIHIPELIMEDSSGKILLKKGIASDLISQLKQLLGLE